MSYLGRVSKIVTNPNSRVAILYDTNLLINYELLPRDADTYQEARLVTAIGNAAIPILRIVNKGGKRFDAPPIDPAIIIVPYSAISMRRDDVTINFSMVTVYEPHKIDVEDFNQQIEGKNVVILTTVVPKANAYPTEMP